MGELMKRYGEISINGIPFTVEMNAPISEENGGIIHIQNDIVRMEMEQKDFYKIVSSLNLAKEQLFREKGMKE